MICKMPRFVMNRGTFLFFRGLRLSPDWVVAGVSLADLQVDCIFAFLFLVRNIETNCEAL